MSTPLADSTAAKQDFIRQLLTSVHHSEYALRLLALTKSHVTYGALEPAPWGYKVLVGFGLVKNPRGPREPYGFTRSYVLTDEGRAIAEQLAKLQAPAADAVAA